jgi:lipopolysaccharide/colanic/teichoic acid biosynthesis glycosyltransferase
MSFFAKCVALFIFILLMPLFILVSILSLIFQGNPIFFKQERVGKNFSIFTLYKFRTMSNNTENDQISLVNKNKVTAWGKILRKTKIDELPQLLNIIIGDMRFIGPRPEIPFYVNKNKFDFLKSIHPGLSDYSSILFRNEEKVLNKIKSTSPYETILPLKISLAQYYCNKKGFWQDLMLVFLTIGSIISPKLINDKFLMPLIKCQFPEWHSFCEKYIIDF